MWLDVASVPLCSAQKSGPVNQRLDVLSVVSRQAWVDADGKPRACNCTCIALTSKARNRLRRTRLSEILDEFTVERTDGRIAHRLLFQCTVPKQHEQHISTRHMKMKRRCRSQCCACAGFFMVEDTFSTSLQWGHILEHLFGHICLLVNVGSLLP